jgi:S-adenosylmethionine synthetase
LLDVVQDQSGKQYKMDHYATRYPTNVVDVADFLVRLSGASCFFILLVISHLIMMWRTAVKRLLPPILHYSAPEPFTKYEICLIFSSILGLPHKHIVPDTEPPSGAPFCPRCLFFDIILILGAGTSRPRDCQLYTGETDSLGVEGGLGCCGFEEWWREYLGKT